MSIRAVSRTGRGGRKIVAIEPIGDVELTYDMVEGLIEVLRERYSVEVRDKFDGPIERLWEVTIDGQDIEIYDDWGAALEISSPTVNGAELVEQIGAFLKERIPASDAI